MPRQARLAALDELYGLGYDYDKTFEERIEAVTPDDVTAVARKYLDKSLLTTSSPQKALRSRTTCRRRSGVRTGR